MKEEQESYSISLVGVLVSVVVTFIEWFYHVTLVTALVALGAWGIHHLMAFTLYESTLVSLGICGLVWVRGVGQKIDTLLSNVQQEDWLFEEEEEEYYESDSDSYPDPSTLQDRTKEVSRETNKEKVIPINKKSRKKTSNFQ